MHFISAKSHLQPFHWLRFFVFPHSVLADAGLVNQVRSWQVMIVFVDILSNLVFTNPHTLQHQSELLIFVK
jgi:hypothetical protein